MIPTIMGLYCMAGNVNEWVADVYRPLSFKDVEEFNPYRGNVITEYRRDNNGDFVRNEYGELIKDTVAGFDLEILMMEIEIHRLLRTEIGMRCKI